MIIFIFTKVRSHSNLNSPLFEKNSLSRSPSLLLLVLLGGVASVADNLPHHLQSIVVIIVFLNIIFAIDIIRRLPTCSGVAIGAGVVAVLFGVVRFCTFASLLLPFPVVAS